MAKTFQGSEQGLGRPEGRRLLGKVRLAQKVGFDYRFSTRKVYSATVSALPEAGSPRTVKM